MDGQGYIRTGNTRWEANIERNPDVTLRIEGKAHPLRVEFVADSALRTRIEPHRKALEANIGLAFFGL